MASTTSADSECLEDESRIQLHEYYDFLANNYSTYRENGEYCDVILTVGEKTFQCHRLILVSNSKYFVSLFKNDYTSEEDPIALPTEYVDATSFSMLLDAMYGKPFRIELNDLIPLFTTSIYLQLTHFIDQCKNYIYENLETVDSVELIALPQLQFDKLLYSAVKKHVCQNFWKFYTRMTGIPLEVLEDIFTDQDLFVFSFKHLIDFGKQWISQDVENRREHLQRIVSLLKPFHAPAPEILKLVKHLESLPASNYNVEVALNTLLELPDAYNRLPDVQHELLTTPLFFLQPNNDSEVIFGTYRDGAWEFWNEMKQFQLPITTHLLSNYEGAVTNNMVYFAGELSAVPPAEKKKNVLFRGLNVEAREWIELLSPRTMPACLSTCNSTIYSYEDTVPDNYQLSVFEPVLNRWFRVPEVKYPRTEAGIATSSHSLYMVGGVPSSKIGESHPTNIIEMYDSRRGTWSRISIPENSKYSIKNDVLNKTVCFLDNKLYVADDTQLIGVDLRNNQWLELETEIRKSDCLRVVDGKLWNIDVEKNYIEVVNSAGVLETGSIPNPNVWLAPISMPYY